MCRDMLTDAMIRAEEAGLAPVLHVHDEVVCDVDRRAAIEAEAELAEIMVTLPEWAEGFPVGAAGHVGERYRK
jgi:DNA polymerase